jgi:iron complex outermembrane receptor protein
VATVFSNAASVIYSGVELETQVIFNDYFRAFFNYGYLNAEYDEFVTDLNPNDDGLVGASPEDASHLNPRNAPGFTYGVGGTLAFPVGNGTVEIFGKFTVIDEIDASLLNLQQAKIAQRDDVSGSIGYYGDKWSVVAFGKNLTDERFEAFFPIATLFAAGFVNRPRTLGIEFTYEM